MVFITRSLHNQNRNKLSTLRARAENWAKKLKNLGDKITTFNNFLEHATKEQVMSLPKLDKDTISWIERNEPHSVMHRPTPGNFLKPLLNSIAI